MPDPLNDLDLPEPPSPAGAYERGMVHGGIGFLSGQFPLRDGRLVYAGRVGAELSEAEGRAAAEVAALNAIAAIKAVLQGSLTDLVSLLRVEGYVASADGFVRQLWVLDGASEAFSRLLGDKGRHARTAFAVPRLPLDAPIELVVTFGVVVGRT
jgi:enamine deaminase RidA (YjgF/YER057c/UK114 family)